MSTFRALAVLASLPGHAQAARDEARRHDPELPYLRAAILESVRLWPTTPAILRQRPEGDPHPATQTLTGP